MSVFKGVVCLFDLFGRCLPGLVNTPDISVNQVRAWKRGVPESTDNQFARLKKTLVSLPLFFALLLSIIPLDLSAQGGSPKLGKPKWISSGSLFSDTGYGHLEWEQKPGEAVELFQKNPEF